MEAICPICSVKFNKKSNSQKYCSAKCIKKHKQEYNKSEKIKEYQKKYRKSEQRKLNVKKYLKSEKYKERQKKYQQTLKYRESRKKACHKYYVNNLEKIKKYSKENYDKYKESKVRYDNSEKAKLKRKNYSKNKVIELSDGYIKNNLNMPDAPKELIEAKREQIKLLRLIKQMS